MREEGVKPIELEVTIAYRCASCEHVGTETSGMPLYECGGCETKVKGEDGEGNRCEDCRRKRKKIADDSCESCDGGEVEELEAIICPSCDEPIDVDLFHEHAEECGTIAEDLRREWAEAEAAKYRVEISGSTVLDVVAAVVCPCGELVQLDEFGEHAETCDEVAGGDADPVGDALEAAIAKATAAWRAKQTQIAAMKARAVSP